MRRAVAGAPVEEASEEQADAEAAEAGDDEENVADVALAEGRYAQMSAAEELILTVTERGSGKLSSSHGYPVRGRGGQGVQAIDKGLRGGRVVAAFPVDLDDQVMLVTDRGQSIRCGVAGISFRSRSAGGVRVLNTAPDESVVSVAWIAEQGEEEAE
jgi:DNA gyrase subunit A